MNKKRIGADHLIHALSRTTGLSKLWAGVIASVLLACSTSTLAQDTESATKLAAQVCKAELRQMHDEKHDLGVVAKTTAFINEVIATKFHFVGNQCPSSFKARCDAIPMGVTPSSSDYGDALRLEADIRFFAAETSGSRGMDYFTACLARHMADQLKKKRAYQ